MAAGSKGAATELKEPAGSVHDLYDKTNCQTNACVPARVLFHSEFPVRRCRLLGHFLSLKAPDGS